MRRGPPPRCARCRKPVRGRTLRPPCRRLYCSRRCFGLDRRKSKRERIALKRAYDKRRRQEKAAEIKAKKAAYFKRTYDPVKAAKQRRATMKRHVAYCRRPEYREKKARYDRRLRAREYGPFAESHGVLLELEREIRKLMPDKYERAKARGYYTRTAQVRRRELCLLIPRN